MVRISGSRSSRSDAQPRPGNIRVVDLQGMIPPLTFLKITQAFREIDAGQTMEIIGSDLETRENLSTILGMSPHELLGIKCTKDVYFIRLKKGGAQGRQKKGLNHG